MQATILVVDDTPSNIAVLSEILRGEAIRIKNALAMPQKIVYETNENRLVFNLFQLARTPSIT